MLFTDGIVGLSFPPTSLYSTIGTYFTPFDSC